MENFEYYSGVELTEEELKDAINAAKRLKYGKLEHQRKLDMEIQREKEIRRPWDHRELLDFAKYRAENELKKPLVIDADNELVIRALCYYFTDNPLFEQMQEGWSLNKGLLLQGTVGTGKTTLMQLFCRNKRACFGIMSARKISSLFAEVGHDVLYQYSNIRKEPIGDSRLFYQREIGTCFDDLGTESIKKHFGNQSNVMGEILMNRYDRKYEFGWQMTHITTNLTSEQIGQAYGTRVLSRFREMFNQVVLTGKDRRG